MYFQNGAIIYSYDLIGLVYEKRARKFNPDPQPY
jgi:hypothetical protein